MDLTAECVGKAEPDVIKENDQNVRRIGGKVLGFRAPLVNRILQCLGRKTC